MVDFILSIPVEDQTVRLGVSVTRAMNSSLEKRNCAHNYLKKCKLCKYPYSEADAIKLLTKKIDGLIVARNAVDPSHTFFQSVLRRDVRYSEHPSGRPPMKLLPSCSKYSRTA